MKRRGCAPRERKKNENERRGEIKALFRIIIAKQRETGLHASPDECSKQPTEYYLHYSTSALLLFQVFFSHGAREPSLARFEHRRITDFRSQTAG